MVGWALPAASLLGSLYMANRGEGGGSEFSPQQEKLFDTQVDIADMMKGLYESRIANEEQYLGDALSRVFQYADRMQNRSPDLLHAPGIFEFMPKGRQREGQSPEWQPFTPEGTQETATVTPPILDDRGLRALEDLNPVTDIVPPIDMGALAGMMPWQIKKMLEGLLPSGGPRDLDEALGLDGETDTDWDAWLNDMPETLRSLERTMEETLGTRDKPELTNPYRQQYDPKDLEELMTRVMSTSDFTPPGEYSGPFEDYIDPTTLEALGPTVPGRLPTPDLPASINVADPDVWANYGGVTDFTGLPPGIREEPAWRTRRREDEAAQEIERGEYWPVMYEGPRTIRTVTGEQVQALIDRNMNFELLNQDGSNLTSAQIEALMAGTLDRPVYVKNLHTGTAEEAGWSPFGDVDYSDIHYLTDAEIAGLLGPIPGGATKHGRGLAARIEERERAEEEKVASAEAETAKTSASPRRTRRY